MASAAPAGSVITQERKIERTTVKSSAHRPRASATPITAPTKVCVVETGSPSPDAIMTVVAVASSAEKPRLGVSSVMCVPMVAITL